MEAFYTYVLQVNVALVIFYLFYRLVLVGDVFLEMKRFCFWGMCGIAFVYPFLDLALLVDETLPLQGMVSGYAGMISGMAVAVVPNEGREMVQWQDVLAWVWGLGIIVLLVRLVVIVFEIFRLAGRGKRVYWEGMLLIIVPGMNEPFSFFRWIFINPALYEESERRQIVLHEQAHVRQWHSLDVMACECLCCLFWFNPVVWFWRRAVRENLEFLADRTVVASGCGKKDYQYLLLRLSRETDLRGVVNNLNVLPLKKRIIMMNKKRNLWVGLLHYALILPLMVLLVLSVNADVVKDTTARVMTGNSFGVEKKIVAGKVVDEKGMPLRGVSVILQGTATGAMTDTEGCFQLNVEEEGILCFSYVGRKTELISFRPGEKNIRVMLPVEPVKLERMVVVSYRQEEKQKTKAREEKEEIFVAVEEMPVFPEGNVTDFLAKWLRYPTKAVEEGVQGTVYVSFVVDYTGKVVEPRIVRGVSEELDSEVLRLVKLMPSWKPGKQRGVPVSVKFTMPVEFKLENSPSVEGN